MFDYLRQLRRFEGEDKMPKIKLLKDKGGAVM
jgi:hypothetical protein